MMERKMKDSSVDWIGMIPNDWCVEKGKHFFSQRNTKGNESPVLLAATQKSGMIPQALLEGVVQVKLDTDLQTFKTVHVGDFVISLRSFQGGFEMSDYEGVCSPAYQVFYSTQSIFHKYYKYLFKSYGFISKMNSLVVGIREGKNIQYKDFAESLLPIPPFPTQQRIADFLDRKCAEIDELAALQEKMIAELKRYKQSVITEAVTKGLDPNVPMKDSGVEWIGEIPEGWEVKRLKNLGYLYGGLTGKSGDDFNVDDESNCPYMLFIPFTNIFNNSVIDTEQLFKVRIEEGEVQNLVLKNDLLFLMSSEDYDGVGKPAIIEEQIDNLSLNSFCKGFRISNPTVCAKYLFYHISSHLIREFIRQEAKGFIRINLRQDKLACIPVFLPPLTEQRAIADYLDRKCTEIDELIAIKQQKIEALKEYKKSVIFEYVTGKKEI